MSFQPPRFRPATPARATTPVLSVGRRVFINSRGTSGDRVALTDEAGTTVRCNLVDGAEVEILAWRPRGSTGPRYRVHTTDGGHDGWLPADNLRVSVARVLEPQPSSEPPPAAARADGRRRFGQSFDPSR
jgi:hypothetical protein